MSTPDRLGKRDPLEVLASTIAELAQRIDGKDTAVLQARPFEGKWTPCEILGHFVDHEIVSACRVRTLRFEDEPWMGHYDQETWVTVQGHNAADPAELLPRFAFLRSLNLAQYESLTDLEWHMMKPTPEGEYSLEQLVQRHANHDLHHLDQLTRFLKAMTEG
ncbi:MAG: DinB family protein [Planctomycetota bacterium]|nr:DinB family protein [Planctomycetota bacterium]